MAGVKGKSGRKSHYDEMLMAEVVNGSTKLVNDYINDVGISKDKRVAVAQHFALKAVPTKIEGDYTGEIVMMPSIKIDGQEVNLDTGE